VPRSTDFSAASLTSSASMSPLTRLYARSLSLLSWSVNCGSSTSPAPPSFLLRFCNSYRSRPPCNWRPCTWARFRPRMAGRQPTSGPWARSARDRARLCASSSSPAIPPSQVPPFRVLPAGPKSKPSPRCCSGLHPLSLSVNALLNFTRLRCADQSCRPPACSTSTWHLSRSGRITSPQRLHLQPWCLSARLCSTRPVSTPASARRSLAAPRSRSCASRTPRSRVRLAFLVRHSSPTGSDSCPLCCSRVPLHRSRPITDAAHD
jgi:hypothetical protein